MLGLAPSPHRIVRERLPVDGPEEPLRLVVLVAVVVGLHRVVGVGAVAVRVRVSSALVGGVEGAVEVGQVVVGGL